MLELEQFESLNRHEHFGILEYSHREHNFDILDILGILELLEIIEILEYDHWMWQ